MKMTKVVIVVVVVDDVVVVVVALQWNLLFLGRMESYHLICSEIRLMA